ncbi:uncharacterized protein BXZ73DRAFT_48078 [Epithele typhae]|uniref:uncharacterized protein n=1 Tax=Epithele typhae TaxID=378194 RepID=UPI002007DDD6|nr:uncharacterized protein BXZ73DRAFT_48078 [Epithele typhae]KAH9929559.1 hypothetical protein BXZ73DRAFT_48078 [Epithele typhae]
MASAENVTVPFFKKKGRGRPATSRKRSASPPATAASSHLAAPSSSSTKSEVVLPARKAAGNLLSAGTKRTVSQREDDDGSGEERDGPDVKWTAAGSHSAAAREIIAGDEAAEVLAKRRRSERRAAGLPEGEDGEGEGPDDGLYRGQKAYASHVRKSKEVPKAMRVGPQRASGSTIRTVTIVDYQPDVCKDYKVETGYCGYGDTCKFLHDRGTYLAGWQLDKLAAEPKKNAGGDESGSDSDDEDIPFACLICRKPYTDPVVTRCEHYFCSACAIKRFARTPKCAACSAPTAGIFNRADKVIAKLKLKQEAREAEAAGDGDEAGGGGGGVQITGLGDDEDDN